MKFDMTNPCSKDYLSELEREVSHCQGTGNENPSLTILRPTGLAAQILQAPATSLVIPELHPVELVPAYVLSGTTLGTAICKAHTLAPISSFQLLEPVLKLLQEFKVDLTASVCFITDSNCWFDLFSTHQALSPEKNSHLDLVPYLAVLRTPSLLCSAIISGRI